MSFPRAINDQHQDEGAPSMSREERLLEAATHNNVETLKQLLDSPELYNVRNANGHNLLHIAISERNNEVFDYLLSLDDFPLDAVDNRGCTALRGLFSYLSYNWTRDYTRHDVDLQKKEVYERYAFALIKKGANTNPYDGDSLLRMALFNGLTRIVRWLIERGADLNIIGSYRSTPLHKSVICMQMNVRTEVIMMLLFHGADPSFLDSYNCTAFDNLLCSHVSSNSDSDTFVALENLFFFTFDEWSSFRFESLFKLAQIKSPLFHQVIKFDCEILVEYSRDHDYWGHEFYSVDLEYLRILLEKYPYALKGYLESFLSSKCFFFDDTFDIIKNLDMIMQSSVCSDSCLEFISRANKNGSFIEHLIVSLMDGDKIIELVYYFLSYGRILDEIDLHHIYKITGYSESFKNLLFMDIQKQCGGKQIIGMPRLIYDVTLDIHKSVENPSLSIDWKEIFHLFAHPKIQNAYLQRVSDEARLGRQLPKMPLLQELARDAFRKYFLKRYEITAAKQFYSLIKLLDINSVLKKIITYEKKLYHFEN